MEVCAGDWQEPGTLLDDDEVLWNKLRGILAVADRFDLSPERLDICVRKCIAGHLEHGETAAELTQNLIGELVGEVADLVCYPAIACIAGRTSPQLETLVAKALELWDVLDEYAEECSG